MLQRIACAGRVGAHAREDSVFFTDNVVTGATAEDIIIYNDRLPVGGSVMVGEGEVGDGVLIVGEQGALSADGDARLVDAKRDRTGCRAPPIARSVRSVGYPQPEGETACSDRWECPEGWLREDSTRGCRPPPRRNDCPPGSFAMPSGCSAPPTCTGDWVLAPGGFGCTAPRHPECADGATYIPSLGCVTFGADCGEGPFA